ncbi:uncharacterized protein [Prorops nasuta]|uniref:uncharacterized protein n=1 Tax=Prorops nasuta TaxID=863751 RepID=UPI0034CDE883
MILATDSERAYSNMTLGDSKNAALKRLNSLENKLKSNVELRKQYSQIIEEYILLGHMTEIDNTNDGGYYLPHHAVIKENSATTKSDLPYKINCTHLIRFREYKYVITADITKMYRQIWLDERDRCFQQILWRDKGRMKTYQLNTLTFGVSSSAFLAIRTMQLLAEIENEKYPRAAHIIKNHMYVDDLLTGSETAEEAREIIDETIKLLSKGGFEIRQWSSMIQKF